jgi:hypothetical protein
VAETFKGLVQITRPSGAPTTVKIGGDSGTIDLFSDTDQSTPTIRIHGKDGTLDLGNKKLDGDLKIFSKESGGQPSRIRFRLSGDTGQLTILDKEGKGFSFSSDKAELLIKAPDRTTVVGIDGAGNLKVNGDISLRGTTVAEDFELADANVPPGSVMVLTDDGRLRASAQSYDKRVVGVLSGADDTRPGLVLGRQPGGGARRPPIALVGKTLCWADATSAPIAVGDLLTTSTTRGHAMRADPARTVGTTIGKALGPLERGKKALVPILVTLQ